VVIDHGDRGLALLEGDTTVERYFITGSVHDFRARFAAHTPSEARLEREQAIADWEKVLEEQPEHPWALNNILQRSEADGLTATTARHLVELSDLHPDNFLFAVHAALAARQVDDEVAFRRLRVRAEGLMTTETEARSPEMAARLRLLPIQDAWLRDDPGAVLAQLQSLETDTQRHRPNQMDTVALFGFYATLGLGRLHDAETRVSRLRTEAHDVAFIRLLKERRDPAATRRFVETRLAENHAANLATALAENGFVDVASRLLQNRGTSAAGTYEQVVEVAVAAGQHKPAEVWRLAARALRLSPFGDRHIQISMMAADALVQTGRLDDAIAVLETTTAHRRQSAGTGEHRWIDARAQLASLYRRVGRVQDASRIETHLLSLLALADADYPLLAELRGRNAGH
jgi:tetratricopeptide (TPR) repeat protein